MADEQHPEQAPLDWSDLEAQLRRRPPRYDAKQAWAELSRAMDDSGRPVEVPTHRTRPQNSPVVSPTRRSTWVAKAAAVLVLSSTLTLAWRAMRPAPLLVAPSAVREVATARGQRANIRLADGTRVQLGPDSKLRYASTFTGNTREVQFEGEGYFDVVHDDRRPFTVRTARAVIRDLGTSFNVRSYADSPEAEVVVADGEVSLAPAGQYARGDSLVLSAGDLGRVGADGRLVARRGVDVGAYLAWTGGRLVFGDTPLRDALPRLSRWYGVDIRLGDSTLAERRYTASLKDETVAQLLDMLEWSLELKAKRFGDTILLYDSPDGRPRPSSH